MKMEYLKYVVTVAQYGSISAAAKELWVGQSSLSMAIKAVEKELNITIFTRTSKGITTTSKGTRVILEMQKMLDSYNILNNLSDGNYYENQPCTISCYPGLSPSLGPHLSANLSAEPYNAILKMKSVLSRKITHALASGTSNIGIGTVTTIELENEHKYANINGFTFEELYSDNFVLCVGKDSQLAGHTTIDISELKNTKICAVSFAPQFTGYYPSLDFKQFELHSVFDLEECVKRTIIGNDVTTFIPSLCMRDDFYVKSGLIKTIQLTGFDTEVVNFIVYANVNKLTPIEKRAIDVIKEFFDKVKKS